MHSVQAPVIAYMFSSGSAACANLWMPAMPSIWLGNSNGPVHKGDCLKAAAVFTGACQQRWGPSLC